MKIKKKYFNNNNSRQCIDIAFNIERLSRKFIEENEVEKFAKFNELIQKKLKNISEDLIEFHEGEV